MDNPLFFPFPIINVVYIYIVYLFSFSFSLISGNLMEFDSFRRLFCKIGVGGV